MALDEQKVARLADRAQHLIALKESPSFPVFKKIVEDRLALEARKFVSHVQVDRQSLDYARGMMFGLQWAVGVIERGEQEFKKALKQAQTLDAVLIDEEGEVI